MLRRASCSVFFGILVQAASATAKPLPPLPVPLNAAQMGVLVNDNDPQSVAVAAYYQQARGIPAGNVIHISIPANVDDMDAKTFAAVKAQVDSLASDAVQAFALTWTRPYLVQCMSITSAFAFGFDTKYCNTTSDDCSETAKSDYFNADSSHPWTDLHLRPTMMLAGTSVANVKALIDRGIKADQTNPKGNAYLVSTTDAGRSARKDEFAEVAKTWDPATGLTIDDIDNSDGKGSDFITGKQDVLFYLTGLWTVPEIQTNTYLPGAIADHLTSFGGQVVPASSQMSSIRWLEAGVTGSFGTVVEPCGYTEKFPDATVLIPRYHGGESLIEAYWKSVAWPGEGLFIGEPLARPYAAK